MLDGNKGAFKYIYEKSYDRFILFKIVNEDDEILYHESFRDIQDAQTNMNPLYKVDWGELIDQVDLNFDREGKKEIEREIEKLAKSQVRY